MTDPEFLHNDKSAYSPPGQCPDLFLIRRIRSHDNSQVVAGYMELAHEVLADISGRERSFKMMRNSMFSLAYGVRTKVCVVSVDRLTVLTRGGPDVPQSIAMGRSGRMSCAAMCPLAS